MPPERPGAVHDMCQLLRSFAPGLSPSRGEAFAEAAAVSFDDCDACGVDGRVSLVVRGEQSGVLGVQCLPVTETLANTWADLQDATENGAYGVALTLAWILLEYRVVKRSFKGTGFDYYVGRDPRDHVFQDMARLEVSGTLTGSREAEKRVRAKIKQTDVSDSSGLRALIVVVDFRTPKAIMVMK